MQTVIVVETKGIIPAESRETIRKKIMKEMPEGLTIDDDSLKIITHTIQGEIGLEFNKE